ncbi:MAG TPA: carboxypeptidase regulatory-like domain-containing protein, partial [Vicinamibacterales bacterium]|nr:carboxypeptidase regulatory-like domain-containing protein [Vicinamibacterales bacterium]
MVRLVWVVALVVLCGALPARGQVSQGRLTGTVTDAQGAVLPGVTVTVTSPALIGTRTTVTEADGKYLFPALASGAYTITFDLSGFKKLTRENVQVVLGQTISADGQMQLGQLTENVTVTGASPIIDVTTTKVGTDLKGEALIAVPNSSDTWGALAESSGIRMQGFDVGGSHKSQQSGYESFGIVNQARVISDGVDHTEGVGGTGFYEDYYANEEVNISALGSDVEMNSPGAAIVTTIKSGGNVFHGLENFAYEPSSFVGRNATPSDISSRGFTCPTDGTGAISCDNPNLLFWEGHADVGGPIAKDKLWFYGAYNQFHINKQVAGVAQSVATDLGLFQNITTKETYKLSTNNTLVGYYQQGHKQKPFRNLSTLTPPESILAQDSWSRMAKGEWQSVISNRTFLTAKYGYYRENWPMVPAVDPSVRPAEQFRSNLSVAGAGWNAFTTVRNKPQASAQMTYYLPDKAGSHDFKFGFEDIYDQYRFGINGQSGPIRYSFATPTSPVPDRIRFADTGDPAQYGSGWTASPNLDQHYAGYAQDRWALNNRVTITAGFRYDYQNVGYQDGNRAPLIHDTLSDGTSIFPASTTLHTTTLLKENNVA